MAARYQITCVNKSDRYEPHERILQVGGVKPDGTRWKVSQEEAIAGIENGAWQFHITIGGKFIWVVVGISSQGHKYLKTEKDGEQPNNLLSLLECP
jgi:hypothetical protein